MLEADKIAIVILAAGGSSRMGKPKQLLPVAGVPLLQRTVNAARQVNVRSAKVSSTPVFVVLGANRDEIAGVIDLAGCHVLHNAHWQAGMSTSIVAALDHIGRDFKDIAGVLLVMCDQPWVTANVLAALISEHEASGLPIVVSSYSPAGSNEKIPGPPAFFASQLFPELLQLQGDAGARKVVMAHADQTAMIDFPPGASDIDTESDYLAVLASSGV